MIDVLRKNLLKRKIPIDTISEILTINQFQRKQTRFDDNVGVLGEPTPPPQKDPPL